MPAEAGSVAKELLGAARKASLMRPDYAAAPPATPPLTDVIVCGKLLSESAISTVSAAGGCLFRASDVDQTNAPCKIREKRVVL